MRPAKALRQESADRSAQDVPAARGRERRRGVGENDGSVCAGHDGPATLEHLDLAVERLGLVYLNTPPALLLDELRWYRRRAVEFMGTTEGGSFWDL